MANMARKLIIALLLALGTTQAQISQCATADAPAGLMEAALAGLARFTTGLPADALRTLGLPDTNTLSRTTLGQPFEVSRLPPTAAENINTNTTLSNITDPTTLWQVPVLLNGEAIAVVTIDHQNSQWKAVSLGSPALARELKAIQDQWPGTKGYRPRIVVAHHARRCFFHIPEVDTVNLTELEIRAQPHKPATRPGYGTLQKIHDHTDALKHNPAFSAEAARQPCGPALLRKKD